MTKQAQRAKRTQKVQLDKKRENLKKSKSALTIVWLRDDMRLADNYALSIGKTSPILPVFIHDTDDPSPYPLRGCGKWYKHQSLKVFEKTIKNHNSKCDYKFDKRVDDLYQGKHAPKHDIELLYKCGDPADVLIDLYFETGATRIVWNERYEPWHKDQDEEIKARLMSLDIEVWEMPGTLLVAPWISNPEVNAAGWGFGSVQWYRKAVAMIPAKDLLVWREAEEIVPLKDDEESNLVSAINYNPPGRGGKISNDGGSKFGNSSNIAINPIQQAANRFNSQNTNRPGNHPEIGGFLEGKRQRKKRLEPIEAENERIAEEKKMKNAGIHEDSDSDSNKGASKPNDYYTEPDAKKKELKELLIKKQPTKHLSCFWRLDEADDPDDYLVPLEKISCRLLTIHDRDINSEFANPCAKENRNILPSSLLLSDLPGYGVTTGHGHPVTQKGTRVVDEKFLKESKVDGEVNNNFARQLSKTGANSVLLAEKRKFDKKNANKPTSLAAIPEENTLERLEFFKQNNTDYDNDPTSYKKRPDWIATDQFDVNCDKNPSNHSNFQFLSAKADDKQWDLGAMKDYNPGRLAAQRVVEINKNGNNSTQLAHNNGSIVVPEKPIVEDWAAELRSFWSVGEDAAKIRLEKFCEEVLSQGLFEGRERFRADREYTAILSPYVRFGELTARSCFHRGAHILGQVFVPAVHFEAAKGEGKWKELRGTFLRRFLWRDLAYWCMWRFPDLADVSLRTQYEDQKWWGDKEDDKWLDELRTKAGMKLNSFNEDEEQSTDTSMHIDDDNISVTSYGTTTSLGSTTSRGAGGRKRWGGKKASAKSSGRRPGEITGNFDSDSSNKNKKSTGFGLKNQSRYVDLEIKQLIKNYGENAQAKDKRGDKVVMTEVSENLTEEGAAKDCYLKY